MFKKLVSYLIIFSILIPDLAGWGNRPAYGMMNEPGEEGEGRSFIPVKPQNLSEETPVPDESLNNTNSQQTFADTGQNPSTAGGEKEHQEEEVQKNLPILDLGQGIVSPNEGKEELSLSSSKLTNLSLSTSSTRGEGEASPTKSSGEKEDAATKEQDIPQILSLKEEVEEKKEETYLLPQNETQEAGNAQNTLLIIVPDETIPPLSEKVITKEKLVEEEDRLPSVQEGIVPTLLSLLIDEKPNPDQQEPEEKKEPLILNDAQESAQKDVNLVNTSPSSKEFDEKTPLLPKKRHILFEEKSQEKKTSLTKDWELAGGESDEELTLKGKSDGIHTDQSDGPSFEGDVRVTRSGASEEGNEIPKNPFSKKEKTEASLRAFLSESDSLDSSEEIGLDLSGADTPPNYPSMTELTSVQRQIPKGGKLQFFSGDSSNQPNTSNKKRSSSPYQENRGSLEKRSSFPFQGLSINAEEGGSELESFSDFEGFSVLPFNKDPNHFLEDQDIFIPLHQIRNLPPEIQDFLHHVKVRIIDGTLNWKQILGIGGGLLVGAGCAWPWMVIMFNSLLNIYYTNQFDYYFNVNYTDAVADAVVDPNVLDAQFRRFNTYFNLETMIGLVAIPMGVTAASRTASILSEMTEDNTQSFSAQKSAKHRLALLAAKSCIYFGASLAGLLPVYYLYQSLLGCDLYNTFNTNQTNSTAYTYDISTDIFLNLSTHYINNTGYHNCTFSTPPSPSPNSLLFWMTVPFLFFSTVLHYGHRLSKPTEKWINTYFSSKSSVLSHKLIRQSYLTQYQDLKRLIYGLEAGELNDLYADILGNGSRKIEHNNVIKAELNSEELSMNESLRVFTVFRKFYQQHKDGFKEENPEKWRKTWASRIGWGVSLIATSGRGMLLWYAISGIMLGLGNIVFGENNNAMNTLTGLSLVLGGCIANVIQGAIEKEAISEEVYNILGGKKIGEGTSHKPLRLGIRIWDTIYGVFSILPYIAVGVEALAPYLFTNLYYDYEDGNTFMAWATISLIASCGIADVFNNVVSLHRSNLSMVNAFDSTLSYCHAFDEYKRDKLIHITHLLRGLFKDLSPDILEGVNKTLNKNYNMDISSLRESEKFEKESIIGVEKNSFGKAFSKDQYLSNGLLHELESLEKSPIVSISSLPKDLTLSETQDFLRYIKIRIVDGTLNWKQILGIGAGIVTGAAVAWPLMIIFYDPIFDFYFWQAASLSLDPEFNVNFDYFSKLMQTFSKEVNFLTMLGIVGIPLGIDAASRTARILCDLTGDSVQTFSLQKTIKHKVYLTLSKGGIYAGAFLAGALPAYYLFASLTECHEDLAFQQQNNIVRNFFASYDIFFNNLSYLYFNDTNHNCSSLGNNIPSANLGMMVVGIPFLMFDTVLQYGHQLSHNTEQWINTYFFAEMRNFSCLSPKDVRRQEYLAQFKDLKRIIYDLDEDALNDLYDDIFTNDVGNVDKNTDINPEEWTINETLRVLTIFQAFHHQYRENLEGEETEEWKKNWSSRIGWGIALVATVGRGLVLSYVISEMLLNLSNIFWEIDNNVINSIMILSFVLGGGMANIIQGVIEKEAVQESVYNVLGGKKIAEGTSHKFLRLGIKIWDAIYGVLNTFPYVIVGMGALGTDSLWEDNYYYAYNYAFMAWATISLIATFGLADAFNNAVAFHDSNLGVVNVYDSLVTSYGTPSTEQKKDRLIRMTRQLRRLFKDLRPDVLEEVDRMLNPDRVNAHQEDDELGQLGRDRQSGILEEI